MSGLTSRQQWTHDHITRCSCGAWVVVTEKALHAQERPCTHLNAQAMEAAA